MLASAAVRAAASLASTQTPRSGRLVRPEMTRPEIEAPGPSLTLIPDVTLPLRTVTAVADPRLAWPRYHWLAYGCPSQAVN